MNNHITIIIPTLNEAENIERLLAHIISHASENNHYDICVVDAYSTDDTKLLVRRFIDKHPEVTIQCILSEKGRAKQMNKGVYSTKGEILYFLHADSFPPKNFDAFIRNEVNQGNTAGCFTMKFDSNHWWLKLAGWLTQFNSIACRGGDQSLFITRDLFNELGGYDEKYTIYEDQDLISKLYARKNFTIIKQWLTTSARRYESNGIWKLQYHFWTIYVKKFFGATADELHDYYLKYIKD